MVKNPPAMQETPVDSWVGKIPWRRERLPTPVFQPRELHGMGSQKVGHDWATFTLIYHLSYEDRWAFCIYLTGSFVQLLSCVWFWDPMNCSKPGFLSFTISRSLLKLMSIKLVMLYNHFILCCPLVLPHSNFSQHQATKVLALQPQHQSFQLIFRVDFL